MEPLLYIRGDQVIDENVDQATITDRYTDESLKFIRDNKDKTFFLYLAHNAPHTPLFAGERHKGKSVRGLYGDVVEAIDESTGKILDLLAELKLADNTLIIYTSDNGPWHVRGEHGGSASPLRAGKGTTYEGGMRVPCVMRWPGKIPAGSVCNELAVAFDIPVTLARLAGATMPTDRIIDGKDIGDLILAKADAKSPHEAFFYYSGNRLNAVRSGEWKLKLQTTLQEETEYGKYEHPQSPIPPKLYNLTTDLGEQKSVLPDHPNITRRLNDLADRCREDLGDARTGVVGKNVRPIGNTQN
jgi:arylsulfatase A-like enzyme